MKVDIHLDQERVWTLEAMHLQNIRFQADRGDARLDIEQIKLIRGRIARELDGLDELIHFHSELVKANEDKP